MERYSEGIPLAEEEREGGIRRECVQEKNDVSVV